MPSELYHQRKIINDVLNNFPNSFAMKTSHRFLSGFPDLLIKIPGEDPIYVEVKKGNLVRDHVKVNTTVLQRKTMKDMKYAGLKVCVWVVVEQKPNTLMLVVPPECTKVAVSDSSSLVKRAPGRGWPIQEMIAKHNWE